MAIASPPEIAMEDPEDQPLAPPRTPRQLLIDYVQLGIDQKLKLAEAAEAAVQQLVDEGRLGEVFGDPHLGPKMAADVWRVHQHHLRMQAFRGEPEDEDGDEGGDAEAQSVPMASASHPSNGAVSPDEDGLVRVRERLDYGALRESLLWQQYQRSDGTWGRYADFTYADVQRLADSYERLTSTMSHKQRFHGAVAAALRSNTEQTVVERFTEEDLQAINARALSEE